MITVNIAPFLPFSPLLDVYLLSTMSTCNEVNYQTWKKKCYFYLTIIITECKNKEMKKLLFSSNFVFFSIYLKVGPLKESYENKKKNLSIFVCLTGNVYFLFDEINNCINISVKLSFLLLLMLLSTIKMSITLLINKMYSILILSIIYLILN